LAELGSAPCGRHRSYLALAWTYGPLYSRSIGFFLGEGPLKVRSSVKPICEIAGITRRGVIRVICKRTQHNNGKG